MEMTEQFPELIGTAQAKEEMDLTLMMRRVMNMFLPG